jgi:hypothetical protein
MGIIFRDGVRHDGAAVAAGMVGERDAHPAPRHFGLYFTWWDRMMGTEHPQYRAIFREVTGRAPALGPGSDVANPGRPA